MRCEVVAIGTELLLGVIVDTNSAWIGEQLALSGIDSVYQIKVGDNFERIEAAIRQALERSDAVVSVRRRTTSRAMSSPASWGSRCGAMRRWSLTSPGCSRHVAGPCR
jgi:Probable molybdopterin binding domain